MLAVAASDLLRLLECGNSGGFHEPNARHVGHCTSFLVGRVGWSTDSDLNITPFANLSRMPFKLGDAEDARHAHISLNNSVDIFVQQDAVGRYLHEEAIYCVRSGR